MLDMSTSLTLRQHTTFYATYILHVAYRVKSFIFARKGPDLEAFSHNPADDSVAPSVSARRSHHMSDPTVPLVLSGISAHTTLKNW